MAKHDENPSVFDEPHMRPETCNGDVSEARAAETLRRERQRVPDDLSDAAGIFDEPDIFPGRSEEIIEQDWSCSQCGYNLRGLKTGHPCPECGHVELYRPAGDDVPSYQAWLKRRIAARSDAGGWSIAIGAALLGGLWALLAAFLGTGSNTPLITPPLIMVIVFGPAIEETMKIAAAALVVESRPYLFRRIEQLQVATLGAALIFAVIENLLYLNVYIKNPSVEIVIWRWTVCVALHVGCTLVATRGLAEVWRRSITEFRPPRLAFGFRALVTAIVIHGSYNTAAFVWEQVR